MARQKAALDRKVRIGEHYRALSTQFSAVRRGKQFGALHNPSHDDRPIRAAVLDYLNHYEIVAIGIRQNILDSRIY